MHYVGKPPKLVYDECFAALDKAGVTDKSRICGVGDSLLHDITGAKRNGIDSIFVADGIHATALGMQQAKVGQKVDEVKLKELLSELSMTGPVPPPTHVIPHFKW